MASAAPDLVSLQPLGVPAGVDLASFDDSAVDLCSDLASLFSPVERLPLSTWSEANFKLSPEYSARTSNLILFGWQKAIFDSFTNPYTTEITLMCGTQLTKTLLIQAAVAYIIKVAPGPTLIVQPKEQDARAFSKERLTPMLRDCECLRGLVSESKQDGNQILTKEFPGGSLSLVGAIAPGNLARRSIRYLLTDEIDKYPLSAGVEGDPVDLARERTITFGSRRKIVRTCSPTIAGRSRISRAYAQSDQRKPWVPCPNCGVYQILKWDQVKFPKGTREERAEKAYYLCANQACSHHWTDLERFRACEKTEWRANKPFNGHAGFWLSHLYSPWKSISLIVGDWLDSQISIDKQKVFINTALAEDWQEAGETPDAELLYSRREDYPFGDDAIIPERGLFLTAAVDVQDSPPRLEVEVVAWGENREHWSIAYYQLQVFAENGQPLPVTSPELWRKLDNEVLQRNYRHANGMLMPIYAMGIDTGNRPKPVYEFTLRHNKLSYGPAGIKLHAVRTVVPLKGTDDPLKIICSISKEDAARKRQGVRIIGVGTHCAKQQLFDAIRFIRPPADHSPAPNCRHFPMYDRAYFDGLCSEVRVVLESGGIEYKKKPGQERNEPLDLAVYNLAMAAIVGVDRFTPERWAELREQVGVGKVKTEKLESKTQPEELTPIPTPPPISVASAPPASTVAAVVATDLRPSLQTRRPATRTVRGSFL